VYAPTQGVMSAVIRLDMNGEGCVTQPVNQVSGGPTTLLRLQTAAATPVALQVTVSNTLIDAAMAELDEGADGSRPRRRGTSARGTSQRTPVTPASPSGAAAHLGLSNHCTSRGGLLCLRLPLAAAQSSQNRIAGGGVLREFVFPAVQRQQDAKAPAIACGTLA
jgi:hypothetical protein